MNKKDNILTKITQFYLGSRDFNGFPIRGFIQDFQLDETELKSILLSLIREDKISLTFGDVQPNPHIKAFWQESKENQIKKLEGSDLGYICAYPSCMHLKEVVDASKYQDRPFTLRLALGEPQLSFLSFDLSVLEFYRNDPRYSYTNNDISGSICVSDKYSESDPMPSSDQVLLQRFGFSYNSELNRAVAVSLRHLSDLSPQHQQIWNAKILPGNYTLHPDYFRTSLLGRFPERVPICDALTEELHHIHEMCKLMHRPPLFKNELREDKKPKEFCFLIRPTSKEYNTFVHVLDKAISENINRKFFMNDVQSKYDEVRKDGKVIVRPKGTIQMLDEWLRLRLEPDDRKPMEEMITTFREIRRLRQPPAHAIDDNVFDQRYIKQQRDLIVRTYSGVRLIRWIFENYPEVRGYEIPDHIRSGKIWTY
ncbi:AAA family ATPase [Chloroflexota bacterium]